jgi:hypothetical protein
MARSNQNSPSLKERCCYAQHGDDDVEGAAVAEVHVGDISGGTEQAGGIVTDADRLHALFITLVNSLFFCRRQARATA